MARAKKDGRNRTIVFDAPMHAAALARLELEADLRLALARDEFELHLQPVVRLADSRIKAFEGLARWQRPGHGFVPPVEFIPVLEESGLVVPFGHWVIREACKTVQAWQQRLPEPEWPVLAVNLSVRQFDDAELFDTIREAVEKAGVDPSNLRFEVTESLTMQDLERGAALLSRLAKAGFGISLDDFGTGYSSLGHLSSLPVDSLKIDRSFVAAMQDEGGSLRIVRAILGLAASIGLSVVAEGVETEEQVRLLRQLGCPYGQGYHFARPLPFDDATVLLERDRHHHPELTAPTAGRAGEEVLAAQPLELLPPRLIGIAGRIRATMSDTWTVRSLYLSLLAIAGFMSLHVGLILAFPRYSNLLSEICLSIGPAVAAGMCLHIGWRTRTVMRSKWILTGSAFSLWSVGSLLATWTPMTASAGPSDFLYFLCSVGLLFAITAPLHEQSRWLFVAMDGFQALLGVLLGFIVIFGKVPFSSELLRPMSERAILWTYDVENMAMVFLAGLRLFGCDRSPERRRYDHAILIYALAFGSLGSLYNHVAPADTSVMDVMLDPGFLLMAIVASCPAGNNKASVRLSAPIAAFIDSIGPVFLTLAVLLAGVSMVQQRLWAGIAAILVAVTIYAVRVSLLQVHNLVAHQQLRQTRDQMERLALEDGLTGVGNRRAHEAALQRLWTEAERTRTPLSGLLIDVDHFKRYNDSYGHPAGDACLSRIGAVLRTVIENRRGHVARYGGEEFVILLPDAVEPEARQVASQIRQAVAALDFDTRTGAAAPATVSIGVATARPPGDVEALLLAMDDALYRAKRKGRDRVEVEKVSVTPGTRIFPAGAVVPDDVRYQEIAAGL